MDGWLWWSRRAERFVGIILTPLGSLRFTGVDVSPGVLCRCKCSVFDGRTARPEKMSLPTKTAARAAFAANKSTFASTAARAMSSGADALPTGPTPVEPPEQLPSLKMLQQFAKKKGRRELHCSEEFDAVMSCMASGNDNRQKCAEVLKKLNMCMESIPNTKGHKPTINYHLHRLARAKFKNTKRK